MATAIAFHEVVEEKYLKPIMLHLLITVVVGKVTPITPPLIVHVSALAEPLSFKRIKRVCQSVGVPVTVNVVAFAIAESSYSSVISVSITAVASSVVVTTRFVIRLFVSVLVLLIVGTVTPSTDITPADTRAILVSDACHSSIDHTPREVDVEAVSPAIGKPVAFVRVPEDGVPRAHQLRRILTPSTATTHALTLVIEVSEACHNSIDHTHSAVDVLAVIPATGNPVQFVSVQEVGVPRSGVTSVGLVALTGDHDPVAVVHTVRAEAPPPTRTSVVAPFASVC